MNIVQEPRIYCKRKTKLEQFRCEVQKRAPELACLLDKLEAGIIPDSLEVLIAISQSVEFFTGSANIERFAGGVEQAPTGSYCATC